MRLREFLSKLTGLSTPLGGISWKPASDEREVVYRLLQRLGNRRLVHHSHGSFGFPGAIRSLELMREDMTTALGELGPASPLRALRNVSTRMRHPQSEFNVQLLG